MSKLNMVGNIKELFETTVVIIKIGTFYEVYNNDAIILSYLLNYKIREVGINDINCGFPSTALNKVKTKLENEKIDYLIVDKVHSYEEIEKLTYKSDNKYEEILNNANIYVDKMKRIKKVYDFLLDDSSKLESVEKLLYEG